MIKVSIRQGWTWGGLEIIFWETRGDKIYVAKPCDLVFEECPGGFTEAPTLKIPAMIADEFLKALAETLDKANVKTDKDAKIQGTLEATRYHLEDLREMLKLKEKS